MSAAALRHFDVAERRRRLVERHDLGRRGQDIESVARKMVGLHATDPATVVLSLWARLAGFRPGDLDDAMYERHRVLRMLGMRRTMFVVPVDLVAVVDAACTKALVTPERAKLAALLEAEGATDDGEAWIDQAYEVILDTLRAHPPLTARELDQQLGSLRTNVLATPGAEHALPDGLVPRVLFLLSTEGFVVRDRPMGSWLSSQHRWSPRERHFEPFTVIAAPEARQELVERWLRTFGPGTLTDISWWAKWTKTQTRATLRALGALDVTVDDGRGSRGAAFVLADDAEPRSRSGSSTSNDAATVSFLPALDPSIMGWKQRDWYLDPVHVADLFDNNGNAGPVIMVDGHVVGAWAQRANGAVVTKVLGAVSSRVTSRIAERAAELTEWLDGTRVSPRFPTPLYKRLAAG